MAKIPAKPTATANFINEGFPKVKIEAITPSGAAGWLNNSLSEMVDSSGNIDTKGLWTLCNTDADWIGYVDVPMEVRKHCNLPQDPESRKRQMIRLKEKGAPVVGRLFKRPCFVTKTFIDWYDNEYRPNRDKKWLDNLGKYTDQT